MSVNDADRRFPPLGIRDIVDETFILWRRHFLTFAAVMAIAVVASEILGAIGGLVPDLDGKSLAEALGILGLRMLLFGIDTAMFGLGEAAVVLLVARKIVGMPHDVRLAYGAVLRRWVRVTLATILFYSVVFGAAVPVVLAFRASWWGTLAVVAVVAIPGAIYVLLGWSFVLQAILLEGHGVASGLRRSWGLVRGQRRRVLIVSALILVLSLVGSLPIWLAELVASSLAEQEPANSVAVVAGWTFVALIRAIIHSFLSAAPAIAATVLYFDLRARNDADGVLLDDVARRMGTADEP